MGRGWWNECMAVGWSCRCIDGGSRAVSNVISMQVCMLCVWDTHSERCHAGTRPGMRGTLQHRAMQYVAARHSRSTSFMFILHFITSTYLSYTLSNITSSYHSNSVHLQPEVEPGKSNGNTFLIIMKCVDGRFVFTSTTEDAMLGTNLKGILLIKF